MSKNKDKMVQALKKDFVKVPNKLFKIGLSPVAITVYIMYLVHSETFHPSIVFMCKSLNLSKPTFLNYRKELLDRGLMVKYYKGGQGRASKFEFTPPSQWKPKGDK